MTRAIFFSIVFTLILALAWKLVCHRKHRTTGLWMGLASYISLVGVYWADGVSLYWLALITPLSLILGLLWAFPALQQLLFHSIPEKEEKVESAKPSKVSKVVAKSPQGKPTEEQVFAEFERRGISLVSEKTIQDMNLGELFKYAEDNKIPIRAKNSTAK